MATVEMEMTPSATNPQKPCLSTESFLQNESGGAFEVAPVFARASKKAGIPFAVANFLNSIVGAGIIGIPFALYHCGLVTGLILLAYVGYLTDQSVRMIVEMGRELDVYDYEKVR